MNASPLISLNNVSKDYQAGEIPVPALKDVSLAVNEGEFIALTGASGSGKSTLLNILGCLDRPTSGEYWLGGREASKLTGDERAALRNRLLGFVFQSFNLLPRASALDNVLLPTLYAQDPQPDEERRRRARVLLERFGLGDRLTHHPSQLSGGQQQRVAIARALVNRPRVVLADEPTGNLDSRTSRDVLDIIRQLHREEGLTIVLVTHDAEVAAHADRRIFVQDGRIQEEGRH